MAHEDGPLPLSRLELAHELLDDYRDLLPELPLDQVRRIAGEQEIIARYEPERARGDPCRCCCRSARSAIAC